ncbi:MAG: hypothetical protein QOI24_2739 [Acidobacteriota bacterium]|jgi:hypothetical protein|nr:hypothetical protein [Acidobacteriota bacterium]
MTRHLLICFFLVSVPVAGVAIAQELPQRTLRRHTSVRDADQQTLFLITEIMHVDPERTENTVLIEDETQHERFIYRSGFDPVKKRSLIEFSEDSGKQFIRRVYDVDFATPVMTFEAPSFSLRVTGADLKQPKSRRALTSQIRETLEPHFLESLELMRFGGLRTSNAASSFYDTLGTVLFHGECAPPENAHEVEEPPDCGFDKAFGFPCSDAQLETIARSKRDGRTLRAY